MVFDKKVKSIYKLFSDYDKELIDLVLDYLKKEETTITILKKKFGPNFDGIEPGGGLSYIEKERLNRILNRIKDLLDFIKILINKENKTIKEVRKILKYKNDLELINYIKNIKKKYQEKKISSLKDFMQDNKLSTNEIKEIIDFYENADEKIAFKYKYGIGLDKIDEHQIAKILKVDINTINKYISNVLDALPNLLSKYEKSKELLKNYGGKKARLKVSSGISSRSPSASPKSVSGSKTRKTKQPKAKRKLITYLTDEELTPEQIDILQSKLNIIIDIISPRAKKTFEILKRLTNNNLLSEVDFSKVLKSEKQNFYFSIRKIKKYLNLSIEELEQKLNEENKNKPKKKLIDYLIDEELTPEQIDYLQNKLKVKFTLQNYDFSHSYNLLFQNNELNLRSIINLSKLNKDEKKSFKKAIIKLKEYIMQILSTPIIDDNRNVYEMMQTDLIIYKAINQGKLPDEIAVENQISINTIIESFIKNINNYNVKSVVLYICNSYPEYLLALLNSAYFSPFIDELTNVEKRVVYLRLLSISNKDITNEYIAGLLGLPVEDIENYEIMSKYDEMNILNLVFKQNN